MHVIKDVAAGSVGEELDIRAGDVLLSIDGEQIRDFVDYTYFTSRSNFCMEIQKQDGSIEELEIEMEPEESLGLRFQNEFMAREMPCQNKCIFCFIDQMPRKMRKSLYFKDDDWRLSLMMGNYMTTTNLDDREFQRIIDRQVSPLYLSVHATDPAVRATMLGVEQAAILPRLEQLRRGGITFHAQIVLCPGYNDGEVLEHTLEDLFGFYPACQSVAVVPVGITKYRQRLTPLQPVDKMCAQHTLSLIKMTQNKSKKAFGTNFVFGADELYILAEQPFPAYEEYEEFAQIEDGIGMFRFLEHDFDKACGRVVENDTNVGLVTGSLAAPLMQNLVDRLPNAGVKVLEIQNDFFGRTITVAGLITGADIIHQLRGKKLPGRLLIPEVMLREGEDVFLDNITLEQLRAALAPTVIEKVANRGEDLVAALSKKGS